MVDFVDYLAPKLNTGAARRTTDASLVSAASKIAQSVSTKIPAVNVGQGMYLTIVVRQPVEFDALIMATNTWHRLETLQS